MGPIGCPVTSVRIYNYTLRNNPEECRSQSRTFLCTQLWNLGTFNLKLLTYWDILKFSVKDCL